MTGEGSISKFTYMVIVGRIQCLAGYWPEAALSSLPCGPPQLNSLLHQSVRDETVTEVTSCHYYHIL